MKTTTTRTLDLKVRPLPEIVDEQHRRFEVTEHCHARVALIDPCQFQVPLGTARYLADQRAHELAHIRFTPSDRTASQYAAGAKVPELYLQAAEDCRVNTLARQADVSLEYLSEPTGLPASLDAMLEAAPLEYLTLFALARTGVRAESKAIQQAFSRSPKGKAALKLAERAGILASYGPDIRASLNAARFLANFFKTVADLEKPPPGLPIVPLDLEATGMVDAVTHYCDYREKRGDGGCHWGEMEIHEPPRPVPCNVRYKHLAPRPQDHGIVPSRVHRWPIDGMIFRSKARSLSGGSVLFDMSGSMDLPFERIAHWLKQAPFATVAAYSSKVGTGDKEGVLTVLAKRGYRTAINEHEGGCGNVVDGPALRWLACQPKPRFWVSDGATTGIGDQAFGAAECRAFCRIRTIKQVYSFDGWLQLTDSQPAPCR